MQVSRKIAEDNLKKYNDHHYHRDHFKIVGVDLKNISPINDVETIKIDINDPEFQSILDKFFQGKKIDLMLSDASINKSGNKFSDQLRQIHLCDKILEIAKKNLKHKGILLIKIFQGQDFDKFLNDMKKEFQNVKSYKPMASKKKSNEIYLIGFKKT